MSGCAEPANKLCTCCLGLDYDISHNIVAVLLSPLNFSTLDYEISHNIVAVLLSPLNFSTLFLLQLQL